MQFFIYYILNKITQTHYFVRVTYYLKRFNGFQYAHMFIWTNQKYVFRIFFLSCSTMFWFDKANRLSAIFFHFGV